MGGPLMVAGFGAGAMSAVRRVGTDFCRYSAGDKGDKCRSK